MPRMEPRVVRRLENCSATDTIAVVLCQCASYTKRGGGEEVR